MAYSNKPQGNEMAAVSLKVMAEAKDGGVTKTTQFKVDPRIIEVEPGFNARPIDPEHVASIAEAYRNGAILPPLFVRVEEGRVIMVDGHHRREALLQLIEEGIEILSVDCMQFRGNDADRVAHLITTASGKPLTPLELGIQYKRLTIFGWTTSAIAERVGKSRQHVSDMLTLAGSDSDVQGMVTRKEVAAHVALKAVKKLGGAAGKVLAGHLEKAQASGKTKVTAKVVKVAEKATARPVPQPGPVTIGVADGAALMVQAIEREINSGGAIRAEPFCPEFAHLITYLRATAA
jgi:ParB/RepB/Spo0J family partition protein